MITQACSLANIIRTGKPTLVIFAAVGIMAYLSGDKLFFALSQFPVSILYCAAAIRWRYRYGDLSLPDEEFTRTQREMKWYLHLLLGFVAVEIIIMCIW
jgi:hypothetical protein